jgi:hypothetical protein
MHAWNCGISARGRKKSWWKVQSWRSSGGGKPHVWLGPMWYIVVATINLENYCPEIILI